MLSVCFICETAEKNVSDIWCMVSLISVHIGSLSSQVYEKFRILSVPSGKKRLIYEVYISILLTSGMKKE
jgi:hypothetical protein